MSLSLSIYMCVYVACRGLPAWLRAIPGMQFRLHNGPFEREMETFTTLIVNKMKDANMFAGQGGPIILAQVRWFFFVCATMIASSYFSCQPN
jgi:hypothetical protein